jgi:hypothetical protein
MKKGINIAQDVILPELKQDSSFDKGKTSVAFWETFTKSLLDFETDAKPVYTSIYSLDLKNAEAIISILPNIYQTFISEIAEHYVLGETSSETEYLIATKNPTFQEQITFYKTLENVVKKVERKRIKSELPKLYDKLTFEIPENTIEATIKKKSREDLREKFKQWNQEIAETEVISLETNLQKSASKDINMPDTESTVFQLSYLKYAVAACFIIGFSIWFYNDQSIPGNFILPSESLAEVSIEAKSVIVIENKGLGFASDTETVTIIENLQGDRIISINKAIETYKKFIEKEVSSQDNQANLEQLNTRIDTLQSELNKLKEREKQYSFNTKELNVFVSPTNNTYQVIQMDSLFYLINNKQLYKLIPSENLLPYRIVQDSLIINQIDDILFKNGLPTIND